MMVGSPEKADSVDASLYEWAKNEPRVLFCGYTNVVEQYLSTMDVYILPSYREGFGSAVIEAEAAVARAAGEAEAMGIIREALQNMPEAYIQQMYVEKWDGKLPTYMTNGDNMGLLINP